jgi:hypothetical protein
VGLQDAPQRPRQDLCLKLLLLFSDVAARVGARGAGVVRADLGDLLAAVAVAAEGVRRRSLRLLGGSSSRMSLHDIQVWARVRVCVPLCVRAFVCACLCVCVMLDGAHAA